MTDNNYLYAGEQFDADLGFYYNRARYLNIQTGRFVSQDTFEGNSNDPISLHKYLYTGNNSINRIDPSGNISVVEMSIVNSIQTILVNSIGNIGFAVADQIRFGGDIGLETIAIGAIASVGAAVLARKVLPYVSSRIAGWLRGASKEKFFFRGTTVGWAGSRGMQAANRTSTSTNPAISHLFAAESASSGGESVVYVASNVDMQGTTIGAGNVLSALENEIVFEILPTQFAQRASKTATIEQSQKALARLGIDVPSRIYGKDQLDSLLRQIPIMTEEQIQEYVRLIQSL